jgi:hypothetical protein
MPPSARLEGNWRKSKGVHSYTYTIISRGCLVVISSLARMVHILCTGSARQALVIAHIPVCKPVKKSPCQQGFVHDYNSLSFHNQRHPGLVPVQVCQNAGVTASGADCGKHARYSHSINDACIGGSARRAIESLRSSHLCLNERQSERAVRAPSDRQSCSCSSSRAELAAHRMLLSFLGVLAGSASSLSTVVHGQRRQTETSPLRWDIVRRIPRRSSWTKPRERRAGRR